MPALARRRNHQGAPRCPGQLCFSSLGAWALHGGLVDATDSHVYVYTCYARDASAAHVPNELKVTVHSGAGLLATAKHHSTRSVTYTARACGTSLTLRCHQRPACEARVGLAHAAHQGRRQKLGAILGAKLQVSVRRRVRVPCALCVWSPRAAESMRCVWYVLVFTLLLLTPAVTWC